MWCNLAVSQGDEIAKKKRDLITSAYVAGISIRIDWCLLTSFGMFLIYCKSEQSL